MQPRLIHNDTDHPFAHIFESHCVYGLFSAVSTHISHIYVFIRQKQEAEVDKYL